MCIIHLFISLLQLCLNYLPLPWNEHLFQACKIKCSENHGGFSIDHWKYANSIGPRTHGKASVEILAALAFALNSMPQQQNYNSANTTGGSLIVDIMWIHFPHAYHYLARLVLISRVNCMPTGGGDAQDKAPNCALLLIFASGLFPTARTLNMHAHTDWHHHRHQHHHPFAIHVINSIFQRVF